MLTEIKFNTKYAAHDESSDDDTHKAGLANPEPVMQAVKPRIDLFPKYSNIAVATQSTEEESDDDFKQRTIKDQVSTCGEEDGVNNEFITWDDNDSDRSELKSPENAQNDGQEADKVRIENEDADVDYSSKKGDSGQDDAGEVVDVGLPPTDVSDYDSSIDELADHYSTEDSM